MNEAVDLLAAINADRSLGSEVLFSHRHTHASAPMHVEINDLWSCADENVLIEAFREGGKTTAAEEWLCMAAHFGNFYYCLLIGETYEKACTRLAEVSKEARQNERLHRLFGKSMVARSIENMLFLSNGRLIHALGWDQELQSFKHDGHRPDLCFFDDPENKERVRDAAAVDESMRKLYLELIPAMDATQYRLRFSQTRRAEDCMVTRLQKNPNWLCRSFPICNGDPDDPGTESLWPARYPMDWIRRKKAEYQAAGMLAEFNQVYRLIATDAETKTFKREQLLSVDVAPWKFMPKFAIYDPARSANTRRVEGKHEKSDRYGKVVVSKLGSKIYVHESSGSYWLPDAFIDDLFTCDKAHEPVKIGIEKNSLDEWLLQPIRIEILRRGRPLPLRPLQAPQDRSKEDFILGLYPFAAARDIVLVGGVGMHPQLVAEWENFPQGPRDVMNALAYSLRMFAGVTVYPDFTQDNIADAPDAARGEDVFVCWNGSPSEVVAAAVLRTGRTLHVARNWQGGGALPDVVKAIAYEVRTAFPLQRIQTWVPAETFDQAQRVPLVPALRAEKFTPQRAEHVAIARGTLGPRMRETMKGRRLFLVDPRAHMALNAFAAGYNYPSDGVRQAAEPESGESKMLAEAIESMVVFMDRLGEQQFGAANMGTNPQGVPYVTALPRARI